MEVLQALPWKKRKREILKEMFSGRKEGRQEGQWEVKKNDTSSSFSSSFLFLVILLAQYDASQKLNLDKPGYWLHPPTPHTHTHSLVTPSLQSSSTDVTPHHSILHHCLFSPQSHPVILFKRTTRPIKLYIRFYLAPGSEESLLVERRRCFFFFCSTFHSICYLFNQSGRGAQAIASISTLEVI